MMQGIFGLACHVDTDPLSASLRLTHWRGARRGPELTVTHWTFLRQVGPCRKGAPTGLLVLVLVS